MTKQQHILLIHSSVNGPLGCLQFGAITDSGAMQIHVQLSVWTYVLNFLGYVSGFPIPWLISVIHQDGSEDLAHSPTPGADLLH